MEWRSIAYETLGQMIKEKIVTMEPFRRDMGNAKTLKREVLRQI